MGAEIRLHPPGPASPSALTQQHPLCRTLRAYVFVQENRRSVLIKISRARCHEARSNEGVSNLVQVRRSHRAVELVGFTYYDLRVIGELGTA